MTAVTGFEEVMAESLFAALPGSRQDLAGDVVWSRGSGAPVRAVLCPLDEPGYVVGGVTSEGYLTLRRAGAPRGPLQDQTLEGQRVTVFGRRGEVPGVVGVRSIHLERPRPGGADPPFRLDDAYVDVGASTPEDVGRLGIEVTSPVALARRPHRYGTDLVAAPNASARAACAALLWAALRPPSGTGASGAPGTSMIAFTRRRHLDADGAALALLEAAGRAPAPQDVVLLGEPFAAAGLGTGATGTGSRHLRVGAGTRSLTTWGLPTRYAGSSVETVSLRDVRDLAGRLATFLGSPANTSAGRPAALAEPLDVSEGAGAGLPDAPPGDRYPVRIAEARDVLAGLVRAYGVSGSETPVRDAVLALLPAWARSAARTDEAGNLRLRVGSGDPLVVFVAHMDETGFAVTALADDGALELERRGGFYPSLFEGRPALVHTRAGTVAAVVAPRDSAGDGPSRDPGPLRADPGTGSRAGTEALGVRPGDTVTMPKDLVSLAGTRVTGRSLDDRAGCAAQILAVRGIDRRRLRHAVEFVWSTREEVGLEGARQAAAELAAERPARVHAIDTFVSSDAPLEVRSFALAPLGKGAVIRAVDDSAVAPPALVDSLSTLAAARGIALQVGATRGGNDGSAFTTHGTPDVAVGWPLRYSHSPAETMDLADLVALTDVVLATALEW